MELKNKKLKAQLFVCTSCSYKKGDQSESLPDEAAQLRKSLKEKAHAKFGKGVVQVSAVKCLGECEHGIATVLYPSQEWNLSVRPSDEELLLSKIEELVEK